MFLKLGKIDWHFRQMEVGTDEEDEGNDVNQEEP